MAAPTKPDPPAGTGAEGGDEDTGPKLSPLEQAIADARQRNAAEGGTMMPPEKKEEETGEGDKAAEESEADAGAKAEGEGEDDA